MSKRLTTPSAHLDRPILVREKFLVLGLINTLQPVKSDVVFRSLAKGFEREKFDRVLPILEKQRMVAKLKNGQYVVTTAGQTVFGSGLLAKDRDISRMLYLFERSKGGREKT